jgi:hypothetical protein
MEDVGMYFMDTWSILRSFGIFFDSSWKFGIFYPVLVFFTKKNLATLLTSTEPGKQGDRMSSRKKSPKIVARPVFRSEMMGVLYLEKSCSKI